MVTLDPASAPANFASCALLNPLPSTCLISLFDIPYVIHLFGFENCMYDFKRGMISKEILSSIQPLHDGKENHMSESANISVATAIADMITDHYQDGVIKDFNLLRLCK